MAGKDDAAAVPGDELVTVKVKAPHNNVFGDKFEKAEGDEYRLPAREVEALGGLVELVKG